MTPQDVKFLFEFIGLFLVALALVAVGGMAIMTGLIVLYEKVFKRIL